MARLKRSRLTLALLSLLGVSSHAVAAGDGSAWVRCTEDAMFVFDASGSMGAMGFNARGKPRISEARAALRHMLPRVAPTRRLGLITYGPGGDASCGAVTLHFRPLRDAAQRILSTIDTMRPSGGTPLTQAVENAAEVLEYKQRPATIVLVTDGRETCGGRTCALAQRLAALPHRITVHVIGFKVRAPYIEFAPATPSTGSSQKDIASCLTEMTGGKYVAAETTGELIEALQTTLACPVLSRRE